MSNAYSFPGGIVQTTPKGDTLVWSPGGIEVVERERNQQVLYNIYVEHLLDNAPEAYRRIIFPAVHRFAVEELAFPGVAKAIPSRRGVVVYRKLIQQHVTLWEKTLAVLERLHTLGIWPFHGAHAYCPIAVLIVLLRDGNILHPLLTRESNAKKAKKVMASSNKILLNIGDWRDKEGAITLPENNFSETELQFVEAMVHGCFAAAGMEAKVASIAKTRKEITGQAQSFTKLIDSTSGKPYNGKRGSTKNRVGYRNLTG